MPLPQQKWFKILMPHHRHLNDLLMPVICLQCSLVWLVFIHFVMLYSVLQLCLPDGLLFRTQKHTLEPYFHPFVITRENGSRLFGFSYVFYEEVASQSVIEAILTLQVKNV